MGKEASPEKVVQECEHRPLMSCPNLTSGRLQP